MKEWSVAFSYATFNLLSTLMSSLTFSYLKSEFVTGYLSILKGPNATSLVGDSPSLPSAAVVPINIFPPGMFSVSSAVCQGEACLDHVD